MSTGRSRGLAAAALAGAMLIGYLAQGSTAGGIPANKVAASGSSTEILAPGTPEEPLLSETVRINNPTDLIIGVTAECSIMTQVTNSANGQTERAFGEVKIYVTIDGIPVKIAEDDTDNGRVVFCNRAQEQQWSDKAGETLENPTVDEDDDDQLRQYLDTRNANGFNWMALNVGSTYPGIDGDSNVHKVEVWAEWTVEDTSAALAQARVGNRTLILEPVKAAHREAVTQLG